MFYFLTGLTRLRSCELRHGKPTFVKASAFGEIRIEL